MATKRCSIKRKSNSTANEGCSSAKQLYFFIFFLLFRCQVILPFGKKAGNISASCWTEDESTMKFFHPDIKPQSKILGLDMDNTIITTQSGNVFPKHADDWKLLNDKITKRLKEYFNNGFKVVIFTNQRGLNTGKTNSGELKRKIENVVHKCGIPMNAYISKVSDINRKPRWGLWDILVKDNGIDINIKESIYCGDAAGRPARGSIKKDHSCADRLFACNIGVPFKTPEEFWFEESEDGVFNLPDFIPANVLENESDLPKLEKPQKPEVIVLVGFPASGKSKFCQDKLAPLGYVIVSRDVLGKWEKCVAVAKTALEAGNSVVIDNTNIDKESRGRYINLATQFGCRLRCFIMDVTLSQCQHNELFRELTEKNHSHVSKMVFNMMRSKYVEPSKDEGFDEIVKVPFVLRLDDPNKLQMYKKFLCEG